MSLVVLTHLGSAFGKHRGAFILWIFIEAGLYSRLFICALFNPYDGGPTKDAQLP